MKTCFIIGACGFAADRFLSLYKYESEAGSEPPYIIAADAGYKYLNNLSLNIVADLIVGDFDSLGYVPESKNVLLHPVEKDDTDMILALREGLARGCTVFYLFGATGGRIDHTYANFQALSFLCHNNARGFIIDKEYTATAIQNSSLYFKTGTGLISVFAADTKALGVTLEGLRYQLSDAELSAAFPLGVSNEFKNCPAKISVADGILLVMWYDNNSLPK